MTIQTEDPIGQLMLPLYDLADDVMVEARVDQWWVVDISCYRGGETFRERGASAGPLDAMTAFRKAAQRMMVTLS